MNIAVVDEGGNLVSHVRMDGAWIGSTDISINKAYPFRAFDISTKDLAQVGGVGVSGGSGEQDYAVAEAGAKAF
jgi:uncharacterized protein GlcG (DUF336 family)